MVKMLDEFSTSCKIGCFNNIVWCKVQIKVKVRQHFKLCLPRSADRRKRKIFAGKKSTLLVRERVKENLEEKRGDIFSASYFF